MFSESESEEAGLARSGCARGAMLDFSLQWREMRGCRSVELRALCNEVPRTPPGPEGSNGTGITSGAADHPEFLSSESSKRKSIVLGFSVVSQSLRY